MSRQQEVLDRDSWRSSVGKSSCEFEAERHKAAKEKRRGQDRASSVPTILITNLRLADDIDDLAGEKEELANLVECLDKASTTHGMEISAEKTKLITNNTSGINTEIKVNGQKLETVRGFQA